MRTFILRKGDQVKDRLKAYLDSMPIEVPQKVTISDFKDTRSLRQNRTYWGWVTIIGDELGYTKLEMDAALLELYAEPIVLEVKGKTVTTHLSTSGMNVEQMSKYLERIIQFAAEQGIYLPMQQDYGR